MTLYKKIVSVVRWTLFTAASLAPLALHAFLIAPKLFSHGSSSAFDMAIGLYVVFIVAAIYAQLYFPVIFDKGRK